MSDFQISEAEIERLLAEPVIEYDHGRVDCLLANPPIVSKRFRFIGDMSLSKALAHPELGRALEDFHDRLVWSKDEPEIGAEGIELFRLNHAFVRLGYPIVSMPPPRVAAGVIWDQTMRQLDPQYRRAAKRSLGPDLAPVLIGNTIHGSRTLLQHCKIVQRQIVAAFRRVRGPSLVNSPGNVQFGDFAEMAENALIRLADRYDPKRSGFPNYARHRLGGIIRDWRNSWVPTEPFDTPNNDPLWHLYSNDEHPAALCERISNIVGSYYPGGQKSIRPVPSDDWLAEGLVDLDGERSRLDAIAAAANLTERQRTILAHLRRQEDGYTYLATKLDISYDHLKVEISRLKKKLRAVVTK